MPKNDDSYRRNTKDDKARRNFELNGGKTQRHIRIAEALAEKRRQDNPCNPITKPLNKSSK